MENKLVYILNSYSKKSAQHFYHVVNLLNVMADQGVEITLVIEKADDIPEVGSKIQVICQKEKGKLGRIKELKGIMKDLYDQGYRKVFVRITMPAAIIAIRMAGKYHAEVYFWQSGDNLTYDRKQPLLPRIKWYLTNYSQLVYIKNHVSYFVTGPESMADYYIENLKVKPEKMVVLYNDIDINRFQNVGKEEKRKIKKRLNIEENKKVVLFVHRLTPVKRFSYQLPYIVETEDFRNANAVLVIVGSGPEEKIMKDHCAKSEYKDCIRMVGKVPNAEVSDYYKIADMFINPSYSEGFPRVVIEAMSSGLPVVATDVGGTMDIVPQEQKNYIVDKDDRELFREKIIYLLNHEEVCEDLSKTNREYVKRFSTENISRMYIEKIFDRK